MRSERQRTARWPALLLAALCCACQSGEVRVCEDENQSMLSDGTMRIQQFRSVTDPTAGGVLQGQAPAGGDRPSKLLLLLDYSGSMFGGYGKEQVAGCTTCAAGLVEGKPSRRGQSYYYQVPAFSDLLARWLDAATPRSSGQELEVLLFNAGLWRLGEAGVEPFEDPAQLTFRRPVGTASSDQIAAWLRQIPGSPYDVDRRAPNSTESSRALRAVLDAVEDEALVWLVTDNIVDAGGGVVSAEDAKRNLEFYNTLRSDPRVQMIAAYPLHQSDPCSFMCGTSLFVYGIYVARFERPPSAEFHRLGGTTPDGGGPTDDGLLWNAALAELAAANSSRAASVEGIDIAGVPLRLKPVDTEVLSFDFALHRGQALRCDARAEYGDNLRCRIRATVRNVLRHQTVESAKLSLSNETLLPRKPDQRQRLPWVSAVCKGQMRPVAWKVNGGESRPGSEPIELGPLAPLETAVVDAVFETPAVDVDTGDRAHIFDVALTDRILLDGRVVAEIRDIRTSLTIDTGGLEQVYGAPELPGIFRGHKQGRIEAIFPAGAVVSNDGQILGLLVLFGGGGLMLALVLVVMRFQRIHLTVLVDDVEHAKLSMPRLSYRPLEIRGSTKATLVRGWGSGYKLRPRSGYRLRKDGATWLLVAPSEGEEIRVKVRRGWGAGGRRRRAATDDDF